MFLLSDFLTFVVSFINWFLDNPTSNVVSSLTFSSG